MTAPNHHGLLIVLTADRTLMAHYPTLLDGMMASIQTSRVPPPVMRRLLAPPMPHPDGRAARAPLGLRRIEAALRRDGVDPDTIAIVSPDRLDEVVGPDTRIVGLSSGDPLGRGMTNTTMVALSGGHLYTRAWFADACGRLRRLRDGGLNFHVVAGGPGAWQLANAPATTDARGIDHVVLGYAERDIADLFARLMNGEVLDRFLTARPTTPDDIPPIDGPTTMGVVEISRGCGRGCGFCTLAGEPMVHLPVERIVADVAANVRGGSPTISLISEDFLRYGSDDVTVDPPALLAMLAAVRDVDGVGMIQVDHANIASVEQFSNEQLRRVRDALRAGSPHEQVWVNLGAESAAGELLAANGLGGKIRPFDVEQWPGMCENAARRLAAAGFVPMLSLILGLPGETDAHVEQTIDLIRRLEGLRAVIFPIFHAPLDPEQRPFGLDDMTPRHWRLFRLAYRFNFRWLPGLFADNHRAAAAPWWRRLFIQTAGRIEKRQWQLKFIRQTGRLRP
ncbi:MAG: B12-binding domain-containing radical SAM protein [Planctomycetota bacterium]